MAKTWTLSCCVNCYKILIDLAFWWQKSTQKKAWSQTIVRCSYKVNYISFCSMFRVSKLKCFLLWLIFWMVSLLKVERVLMQQLSWIDTRIVKTKLRSNRQGAKKSSTLPSPIVTEVWRGWQQWVDALPDKHEKQNEKEKILIGKNSLSVSSDLTIYF